jgi:DNA-binding response OmpR family regulator
MIDNPKKLLIIDDEFDIVFYARKIYEKKGFLTFGADNGLTAVEIFKREKPDITLIDIHMPFSPIDGIEVLRRIKEIDRNAICIMFSRVTEKQKIEESKKLGADGYLLKPVDIEDLDRIIYEFVK